MTKRMVKITIDELAAMMMAEFEHLRNEMNTRFEKVDDEFKKVYQRFDRIDRQLEVLNRDRKICQHHRMITDARLDHLEAAA